MGDVHDLDHIKLDLDDKPSSSVASKTAQQQSSTGANRSIQTAKINHKLEYYLALIGSSKGVALLKLIEDLLGSNGIYVFGEILETKPIQELAAHPTDASYYELLEIYAYGTWKDYWERQDHLPKLNEPQIAKLKLLSIIARASHSRIIPYNELMEELEIDETQALEELIIDGIYSGLLGGRLDQKYSRLEIESSVGRDVRLRRPLDAKPKSTSMTTDGDVDMDTNDGPLVLPSNTLAELHSKLASWRESSGQLLEQLDARINLIRQKDQAKLDQQVTQAATIETLSHAVYTSLLSSSSSSVHHTSSSFKSHSGGGSGSGRKGKEKDTIDPFSSDHQMEIDEHDTVSTSKTRKRTRP
ncbi:hypothetical protein PGT21_013931 [Puccinia graminis f. sp. tritici]|uniref:PCI domain-containing protein n=1 Tax=Puccinia graminis f. sp. tritici TaxID=56615 RepID=A0A5B0Q2D8_PUCGR|nr:hypothetical protein PGT21_013931 [Puccinia graminis f. sp. tritici]KAA1124752.1 hypothetical protein PGTUg99_033791 [Puccinia graminis f. sp. tritici]